MAGDRHPRGVDQLDDYHLGRGLSLRGRTALMAVGRMSTPLARVRGLGPAHSGTDHFWHQRLTAVANVPLIIAFVFILIALLRRNHAAEILILGASLLAVILLSCIISVATHMRIDMQVIIEAELQDQRTKLVLLIANAFFVGVVALASDL